MRKGPYLWCVLVCVVYDYTSNIGFILTLPSRDLAVQWIVEDHFGSICNALTAASNQSCVQIQGTVGPGWGWLLSAAVLFGAVYVHTSRYFGLCHIVGPRGIDIDT